MKKKETIASLVFEAVETAEVTEALRRLSVRKQIAAIAPVIAAMSASDRDVFLVEVQRWAPLMRLSAAVLEARLAKRRKRK